MAYNLPFRILVAFCVSKFALILTIAGLASKTWHKGGFNQTIFNVDGDNYDGSGIPLSTLVCVSLGISIGLLCFIIFRCVTSDRNTCMILLSAGLVIFAGILTLIGVGVVAPYISSGYGSSFYLALFGGILYLVSGLLLLVNLCIPYSVPSRDSPKQSPAKIFLTLIFC
ncbi:hypothetical protein SNE40_009024 [Patella caerulea]|uniref:Uncharacterized protein n=1 Tax=Patella caerulea TaxID=87958 RepID=A0AAN8PPJ7_PATCE